MKSRLSFHYLAFLFACLLFLGGCSSENAEKWEAACVITLDNMPAEYSEFIQDLAIKARIQVTLRNTGTNQTKHLSLTDSNNFTAKVPLKPGNYEVNAAGYNLYLMNLDVTASVHNLQIKKGQESHVSILLSNPQAFVDFIKMNQPQAEILNAAPFSRKIQYQGQMIDLNTIHQTMQFTPKEASRLSPGKTGFIPSTSHLGVALMMQNKTAGILDIRQCTPVGVRLTTAHSILPKGIQIGQSIPMIAHVKTGRLGTPDYCLGSPLADLESITLVYLDEHSGDKISLHAVADDSFINSIVYEFEVYE